MSTGPDKGAIRKERVPKLLSLLVIELGDALNIYFKLLLSLARVGLHYNRIRGENFGPQTVYVRREGTS